MTERISLERLREKPGLPGTGWYLTDDEVLALVEAVEAAMLLHGTPFDAPDWTDRNLTLHVALAKFDFGGRP